MRSTRMLRTLFAGGAATMLLTSALQAADPPKRKPDLGDVVQGAYHGDVISDSKGSSQSDVNLTVTRIGVNLVEITSDYPRLPTITIKLTRAMDKILAATGNSVFLYDPAKSPPGLDVTFNMEVSWSGSKE